MKLENIVYGNDDLTFKPHNSRVAAHLEKALYDNFLGFIALEIKRANGTGHSQAGLK